MMGIGIFSWRFYSAKVTNCAAAPMCVIIISIYIYEWSSTFWDHFQAVQRVCVYQHLHYCYFLLKKISIHPMDRYKYVCICILHMKR